MHGEGSAGKFTAGEFKKLLQLFHSLWKTASVASEDERSESKIRVNLPYPRHPRSYHE
jgi:hypothetical protein